MARQLLLARHGTTGAAYQRRYVGATDLPLDPVGRRQALALAERVRACGPTRCFSSPLRRAAETAHLLAAPLGLKVETVHGLREADFGLWEGKTFEEVQASDPDAVSRWATDPAGFVFPGGEAVQDFTARVERTVDDLAADPAELVLAVAHGGVIRAAICHLLGLPPNNYMLFDLKPASLATIALFDGKGVLSGLDNSCSEQE